MTILLIGHDANRAGAQLVLLQLMRLLSAEGIGMRLLLGEGGPLLAEYEAICPVTIWPAPNRYVAGPLADRVLGKLGLWQRLHDRQTADQQRLIRERLGLDSVDLVLVNTVTSSRWFDRLAIPATTPVVTFVHELAMSVRIYTQPDQLVRLLSRTNHLLAVSRATADYYVREHGFDPAPITLFTLIDTPTLERNVAEAAHGPNVLATLGIPENAVVVGGCGNAEWRKGNDLFVTMARQITGRVKSKVETADVETADVHFVWVGVPPGPLRDDLILDIQKSGLTGRVHLVPPTPDVLRYMHRFDVFVLCSREDPYPLVVLEAGLSGVPVVCFADAGGSPELIESDGGFVVPYLDMDALSGRVVELIGQPARRRQMGGRLRDKIRARHPARQSVQTLLGLFHQLVS